MQSTTGAKHIRMFGLYVILVLLLGVAGLLIWHNGSTDEHLGATLPTEERRTTPASAPIADATKVAAPFIAPVQQPPQIDPFKAALEASRKNHVTGYEAPAATGVPIVQGQDPFLQALEASKQKKPATLGSPFVSGK